MRLKLEQEAHLKDLLQNLGGVWPFEMSDDERRMHSELIEVINRNARQNNVLPYTRAHGTGLRVPGFTNLSGDPVSGEGQGGMMGYGSAQSASPGMRSSSSGGQQQIWNNPTGLFKEEDEFDEDML